MPSTLDAFLQAVGGAVAGALAPVNRAPTAVALTNTTTAIDENTATASHIKVADIAVTDDGLGTNTLGLAGVDAAFFEIEGTSLYLKAGTVLDFETKAGYAVAVTADDTTVGTTPDATSAAYTLAVTDLPVMPHIRGYTGPVEERPDTGHVAADVSSHETSPRVAPSAPVDVSMFVQDGPSASRAFSAQPENPFDPFGVPHQDDSFAASHLADPFAFLHESDPFAGHAFPATAPVSSLHDFGMPILRGALAGPHEDFLLS